MGLREKVDNYFLTVPNAYSDRRKVILARVAAVAGSLIVLSCLAIIYVGGEAQEPTKAEARASLPDTQSSVARLPETAPSKEEASPDAGVYLRRPPGTSGSVSNRQYSASQLVRRAEGAGSDDRLPMGSPISAVLSNTVLSSDSISPVIAMVTEDIYFKNVLLVPRDTKALGTSALDETTQRLQVRFHTFVFPDGSQHAVAALALQPDGSSGIPGNFHSGRMARQGGRFLGKFAGGLADGLKDRAASGWGRAYEPGSIKNGLLNGISESAFDQAEVRAEEMKNVRGYLEVPAGSLFVLFLEREFKP